MCFRYSSNLFLVSLAAFSILGVLFIFPNTAKGQYDRTNGTCCLFCPFGETLVKWSASSNSHCYHIWIKIHWVFKYRWNNVYTLQTLLQKNVCCLYSATWSFKTKQNLHTQHCPIKQFEHLKPRNLKILLADVHWNRILHFATGRVAPEYYRPGTGRTV